MNITTHGSLVTSGLHWSLRKDVRTFTVICKLTFDLVPGEARLSEHQLPINDDDNYWNDDETRSLHAPSDIVPTKPVADVVLVGHAFAPEGKPTRALTARLRIGEVDKSIEVVGDRVWLADGRLHEGPAFTRMSLRYERAAFGRDNPVGIRHEPNARGSIVLPNLQPPGTSIESPSNVVAPIGFGPIAPVWPVRTVMGRHLARDWAKRAQQKSLPVNFDLTYFQIAPTDQRMATLRPDERIELDCLHPAHPRLATRLPGLLPRVVAELGAGKTDTVPIRADTLWIDTDLGICTVTFRSHLRLDASLALPRVHVHLDAPMPPSRRGSAHSTDRDETNPLGDHAASAAYGGAHDGNVALPFAAPDPNRPVVLPPSDPRPRKILRDDDDLAATRWIPASQVAPGAALPFEGQEPVVDARPNFPPPPPLVLAPPKKAPPPQTLGEAEMERRSEREAVMALERAAPPATPDDGVIAKASARAVVKPITKRKAGADAPAKPTLTGGPPTSPTAASNAAADPVASDHEVAIAHCPPQRPAVAVELIHFDPTFVDVVRGKPEWRPIVSGIKAKPRDADFTEDAPPDKKKDAKNRRDMAGILARGEPSISDELRRTIADAVDEDGMFVPPLVLLSGELAFPFDELETLKATLAAVTPFARADNKLKEIVEVAREATQTPWLQGAGRVAEGLTAQVREAFGETRRGLPAGYLEAHTERILLEQRHYQKRTVMGQPWIRALFTLTGASAPTPAYLPIGLAKDLPMYERLMVRMVAEARWQLDQYESAPMALRVVVLGRTIAGAGRS